MDLLTSNASPGWEAPHSSFPFLPNDSSQPPRGTSADMSTTINLPPMDRPTLRRFIAPLSKEQLVELVSELASTYPEVHKRAQSAVSSSPASRRLMVRNIGFTTTDEAFFELFKQFGEYEDAIIVRDKDNSSKGYGFVTFKDVHSVRRVLDATLMLDGRQLHSKLATDRSTSSGGPGQQSHSKKLFVRNLCDSTTSKSLNDVFSCFGDLEECVVVSDLTGRSRGYGFVTFQKAVSAAEALQEPQRLINGRVALISYAIVSKPKARRGGSIKAVSSNNDHGGEQQRSAQLIPSMFPTTIWRYRHPAGLPAGLAPQFYASARDAFSRQLFHHLPVGPVLLPADIVSHNLEP